MDPVYYFAHHALQLPLRRDPSLLEGVLADTAKRKDWLENAAIATAECCGIDDGVLPRVLVVLSEVHVHEILGRPAVIVAPPKPRATTHCHLVAAFRGADGGLRYYTLERSITPDQPMLCRWPGDGSHVLIGAGPKPDIAAFCDAIAAVERKQSDEIAWEPTTGSSSIFLPMSYFPHEGLQSWLRTDPARFDRLRSDPEEQQRWIDFGIGGVVSWCRMPPALANAMRKRIQVHCLEIAGRPAMIVEMPPPRHVAECSFLAILRRESGELRYYALERGMTPDKTMLCFRRADREHAFMGDGPPPELAAFRDAVEQAERDANGGDPPSGDFPEGVPWHH